MRATRVACWFTHLFLIVLGACPRTAAAKDRAIGFGRLEVRLSVVAWPAPDSGVVVFAQDAERGGKTRRARTDRRGVAVFASLRPGYYLLRAGEGQSGTLSALVIRGDTTRVVLFTKQHGHVPSVFK